MKHTPGPWRMVDRKDANCNLCGISIWTSEKSERYATPTETKICELPERYATPTETKNGATINGGHAFPEQLANAQRIVSCVNNCEGINPEAVPDMLEALKAQHSIIINILTDRQLDMRLRCGQTIREYTEITEAAISKATT